MTCEWVKGKSSYSIIILPICFWINSSSLIHKDCDRWMEKYSISAFISLSLHKNSFTITISSLVFAITRKVYTTHTTTVGLKIARVAIYVLPIIILFLDIMTVGWCLNDCGGTWQVTCQLKFTTRLASEGHVTIVREHFLDQCKIV